MSGVYGDTNISELSDATGGATTCTAASTDIFTPKSGRRLRLRWIAFSLPSTAPETLVTVSFGGTEVLYMWTVGAFSRRSARLATNADAPLNIALSPPGGPCYVNYEIEEL